MTQRERLLKTLKGEKTDRMPISPFIYNNFIFEYFDVRPRSMGDFLYPKDFDIDQKTIEVHDAMGFDAMHRVCSIWDYLAERPGEKWDVAVTEENTREKARQVTAVRTPERTLRQVKEIKQSSAYTFVEAITEYFIKEKEDFEQFVKYQPKEIVLDCGRITRTKKLLGDKGVVADCAHGAFNTLNMYRRLDDMMVDPYVDEVLYREMMSYFTRRAAMLLVQTVQAGADVVNPAVNMATGSAVGPQFFEKYVLEYEKELNAALKNAGALILNHNCGDAKSLFEVYRQLPMDAYESLTPPPFGDTELEEAFSAFKQEVTLSGNVDQVEFMVKAKPDEVYERVKDVVLKGKARGNFILSTSDWFFDGTPRENIRAFVQAGVDYGSYN